MLMLTWMGLHGHDVKRLRRDVGDMFNGRLWIWVRVRWGHGTAYRVHMRCGRLLSRRKHERERRSMHRWELLHGRQCSE